QIFGSANTHQIPRLIGRQSRTNVAYDVPHHLLFFPDAETADGVTVKTNPRRSLQALASQIAMSAALNDPEQRLRATDILGRFGATAVCGLKLQRVKLRSRTLRPASRQLHATTRNVNR